MRIPVLEIYLNPRSMKISLEAPLMHSRSLSNVKMIRQHHQVHLIILDVEGDTDILSHIFSA